MDPVPLHSAGTAPLGCVEWAQCRCPLHELLPLAVLNGPSAAALCTNCSPSSLISSLSFLFRSFCGFSCYFLLSVFCIRSQVPAASFLRFSCFSFPPFLTFFVLYPGGSPSSFSFLMTLRPNAGHDLLILEVSRSHTTTHHSR